MTMVHRKIPLYLISGFLGSGKTTLLGRIHKRNRKRRIIYLINDFAAHDVEADIFEDALTPLIKVPGGSIFCTCLVTDFIGRLKEILEMQRQSGLPWEGLVIEASGIANPCGVFNLLRETRLEQSYAMHSVICITDPVTLPKLLQTLPNISRQISMADHIILNKTDLVSPDELARVESLIRSINEWARLSKTRYCRIDWNPLTKKKQPFETKSEQTAHLPQREYDRFSLSGRKRIKLDVLRAWLDEYQEQIYRIKGFVIDEGGQRRRLDYSQSSGLHVSGAAAQGDTHIEFIFAGDQADRMRAAIRGFYKKGFDE